MKRTILHTLAMVAVLAGIVSCSKINDIDERLSHVENNLRQLESLVAAGAYITSVETTADGITFVLSNGQSYKVANGKDGEAVIANIKIEDNFVVIILKDGETMRLSYQNPLSLATLNIVPDYDDGTVRKPVAVEAMGMKSNIFYLDVAVTPARYAEILSDTERFIHKAVFSPVQARGGFGLSFAISPRNVLYADGAPVPFLQACFELDDNTAAMLLDTPHTVSYSIEDKDGVHGAATAFVTISNDKGPGSVVYEGALPGKFTVNAEGKQVYFSRGNLRYHFFDEIWLFYEHQYDYEPEPAVPDNESFTSYFQWGYDIPSRLGGPPARFRYEDLGWGPLVPPLNTWRTLSMDEWAYLLGMKFDRSSQTLSEDRENPRWNLKRLGVNVMGTPCAVLYPDNYRGNKDETFETEMDYNEATEAGIVFLPFAGLFTCGKVEGAGTMGTYFSSTEAYDLAYVNAICLYPSIVLLEVCAHRIRGSVRIVTDCISGENGL